MIYLIGGPPKCGKTILAKLISKKFKIPWVSTDTLQVVARDYIWKYAPEKYNQLYPHSELKGKTNDETYTLNTPSQIARAYIVQAKATYAAIDMFSICEITDGNDFVIEGYHITPVLTSKLIKKYGKKNIKGVFLVKTNEAELIKSFSKTKTPNDWIIYRTKDPKTTYPKIAKMICEFSRIIERSAKKYKFKAINTHQNFHDKLKEAANYLCAK
jgi:2-phosphoglycerate kinase